MTSMRSYRPNKLGFQPSELTLPILATIIFQPKQTLLVVEGDVFANQTCLNMILELILESHPGYVRQLDAFYCRTSQGYYRGVNILEEASFGDMANFFRQYQEAGLGITDVLVSNILQQVLTPLFILKQDQYGFCHNDLKTRNVFVTGTLDDPIFQLADFDKSSIFWHGIRFGHTAREESIITRAANYHFNGFPTKTVQGRIYYNLYPERISGQNTVYLMNTWIPMFASHDIYTFVLSLLCEPIVWAAFSRGLLFIREFGLLTEHVETTPDFVFPQFYQMLRLLFGEQLDRLFQEVNTLLIGHLTTNLPTIEELRSIRLMNNILSKYDLLINVDPVYTTVGVDEWVEVPILANQPTPRVRTYDNHICTSECQGGICNTNKYSRLGYTMHRRLYETDPCKV